MKREWERVNKLEVFENSDVGVCAQVSHKLVLVNSSGEHFHAQMPMKSSSVIVWPVKKLTCKGLNGMNTFFEPDLDNKEVKLVAIYDFKKFRAIKIRWRSWAWQRNNLAHQETKKMCPAIRAFMDGNTRTLFEFMCIICFGKLSRPVVEQLCKINGFRFEPNQTFFQLLLAIIMDTLKLDRCASLDNIAQRLAVPDMEEDYAEHVLSIDEAVDVLEEQDIKVLNSERKAIPVERQTREDFKIEYTKHRVEAEAARAAKGAGRGGAGRGAEARGGGVRGAAGRGAEGRGRGHGGGRAPVDHIEDDITTASAKRFLPPGGQLWCGHKRHEWCGWMPPFSRISYMWFMLISRT